jgi:hypothetical protein
MWSGPGPQQEEGVGNESLSFWANIALHLRLRPTENIVYCVLYARNWQGNLVAGAKPPRQITLVETLAATQ